MDVFDAIRGLVDIAWLPAARTLVRRIRCNGDIALFGEVLRIQPCDLLLDASVRVRHHDRRAVGGRLAQ